MNKGFLSNILNFQNVVLTAITIASSISAYKNIGIDSKLGVESRELENKIKQKSFENELRFKIYGEVLTVLDTTDGKKQEAVRSMVEIMLKDDSVFKERMLAVMYFDPNTVDSVRNKIAIVRESINQLTDSAVRITPRKGSPFRVDVFYLEDIPIEAKPRAEKVAQAIKEKNPSYDVRLRVLPKTINDRPGYRISSNQIRCEISERSKAQELLKLIESKNVFQLEQPEINQITYKTPAYISIFIRNM